ncbi:hypothetical protein [Halomicrobium katesii]|uniref:hypothetical protein n=1 Tax=Halomicrobium katesii TaxID=437163 RepID=UPI00035D54F8|nr:hypothetical protein [Halomicrobium katesii]
MIGHTTDGSNRSQTLAVLLATLVGLSMVVMAGGAVAQTTETATPTPTSNSDELADETVSVDNDTQEVYLKVTNTSGDTVDYVVYGIDEGITTEVNTGTISATAGNSTETTFAADTDSYDSYRFVVNQDPDDGDNESVESVEVGEIVTQSSDGGGAIFAGGGGGLLTPMNLLIAVLIFAGAYLLGVFDPVKRRISG